MGTSGEYRRKLQCPEILKQLAELDVSRDGVTCDPQRVSTRKVRYVSIEHGQQVFRADEETNEEISGEVEGNLIAKVREKSVGARVIFCSDYLKGVLTARVLRVAFEAVARAAFR